MLLFFSSHCVYIPEGVHKNNFGLMCYCFIGYESATEKSKIYIYLAENVTTVKYGSVSEIIESRALCPATCFLRLLCIFTLVKRLINSIGGHREGTAGVIVPALFVHGVLFQLKHHDRVSKQLITTADQPRSYKLKGLKTV